MTFNYRNIDLPITEIIPELLQLLSQHNKIIINAPAGAGKTTILPLAMLLEGNVKEKIIMLEPRRLAAKTVAERMASLLGEKAGETVGYRIRFETKVSRRTRLEVVTEGILTRMLQSDNELPGVSMVIFDEFHERSIHADLSLALTLETQNILRPDLCLLVMSATLDMPVLEAKLGAQVIKSEGRIFPVKKIHAGDSDLRMLPELTSQVIKRSIAENPGDILVFLPGKGEIIKTGELLKKAGIKNTLIQPLYGALTSKEQTRAIQPDSSGKRKIVLSTNIAETSLTIEGIKIVIDSGVERKSVFNPNTGLSGLETVMISQDSATQRAGRAGRLAPGICYQMWSLATEDRMKSHRTPEILDTDLSNLVLELANWGIEEIDELRWITTPPDGAVYQAKELLNDLGALDDDRITPHGKEMLKLPCHPRIAHMLMVAREDDSLGLATDIAAIIEEKDVMSRETGVDINIRIEALRRSRSNKTTDQSRFRWIEKTAESYRKLFDIEEPETGPVDPFETGMLIAQAYPERIASSRPGNNAQFKLASGKVAMMGHKDELSFEPWIAVAHIDSRQDMGKIFMASQLNPTDLRPFIKEKERLEWNTKTGGLTASKELRIGNIILKTTPVHHPDTSRVQEAIINAIQKEGAQLLNFNDDVMQLIYRMNSLKLWRDSEKWPDFSIKKILNTSSKWLTPYLHEIKTPDDLKRLDLKTILYHSLSVDKQQSLDKLAPEKIEVPSGSKLKITYRDAGEPPILAVRIQEVFGLGSTPRINEGRTPLLMHLLSPGFKPVQVTEDLSSFWSGTYFEVRKELKRRYPKHLWPDNPGETPATNKTKKQLRNS